VVHGVKPAVIGMAQAGKGAQINHDHVHFGGV
jgi:hypothetical protein